MTRRSITLLALVGTLLVGGATQAMASPDLTTSGRPVVCLGVHDTPIGQCISDPLPDVKDTLDLP